MPTNALLASAVTVLLAVIAYLGVERHQARKAQVDAAATEAKTPVEVERTHSEKRRLDAETQDIVITNLKDEVARQSARIAHLEEREKELLDERDALKTEIDQMRGKMADMQSRLAELSDRITDHTD